MNSPSLPGLSPCFRDTATSPGRQFQKRTREDTTQREGTEINTELNGRICAHYFPCFPFLHCDSVTSLLCTEASACPIHTHPMTDGTCKHTSAHTFTPSILFTHTNKTNHEIIQTLSHLQKETLGPTLITQQSK